MVCSPCSWLLLSFEVLIWTYWGIMAQMCAAYTKLIWGKDVVWGGGVTILHTKFIWRHHVKGMSTQHRSFSNPSPWGIINWSLTHHLAPLEHFNELSIINTVWSYAEFRKNLPVINRSCANARRNCKTHPLKIFTVYSVCLWYICAKSLQTKVYWL